MDKVSKLTKSDYIFIADLFIQVVSRMKVSQDMMDEGIDYMCELFSQNKRFDEDKFRAYLKDRVF